MFDHWHEFYLLAGSAAAVLIGLIFVVISLMQDRSRSTVLAGSKLYMGPIVLGVSFVLVLSPSALCVGLGFVALAFWRDWRWAHDGLAAVITGSLLLAIRNEWDLITWIAPRRD